MLFPTDSFAGSHNVDDASWGSRPGLYAIVRSADLKMP